MNNTLKNVLTDKKKETKKKIGIYKNTKITSRALITKIKN